jgi:hypothetical protein
MSAAAGTSMLNYNSKRQPALSATMERVKIPPQNGTSFEMGSTIDLRLPNMPHGNFLDMHNSYLKLNIRVAKAADANNVLFLPQHGVYGGLIQRVEIISAAQTISVIDEYAKLCNIFLSSESDKKFQAGVGSIQYGMADNTNETDTKIERGQPITSTTDNNTDTQDNFFCFPLILTNLMSSSKYIPLFSSDNIIIRLTLNSVGKAFVTPTTTATASTVKIENVEMVNQIVKLDPMAAKLVDDSVGGRYEVVVGDWRNAKSQIAQANTTMNVNLGFSFASLSRVIFAFYKTGLTHHSTDFENNRGTRNISEYSLQINGVNHPAQRIKADTSSNLSEVLAEIRGSTRQSLDFTHQSSLTKANFSEVVGTGTTTGIGSAFYEIDTEGLRNYDNEDGVYSGVYTVGSVTSLDATMSAAAGADNDMQLNVWGQFQATLSLDTRGDNIFTYRS